MIQDKAQFAVNGCSLDQDPHQTNIIASHKKPGVDTNQAGF